MTLDWTPLRAEIAEWRERGGAPRFWLRDDDAIEPTTDLDRLIDVTRRHGVPLVLAVIPATSGPALARRLRRERHVVPVVHGWSHANHAPEGAKRQELGLHRPLAAIADECARALARMRELHGEELAATMVPPWNRIAPEVAERLPDIGYRGLSAFGRRRETIRGLTISNTHVDLIDWRGTRRCHEAALLIERIAADLAVARQAGDAWCGVLSHHLAGDPKQFEFLDALFEETRGLWHAPPA